MGIPSHTLGRAVALANVPSVNTEGHWYEAHIDNSAMTFRKARAPSPGLDPGFRDQFSPFGHLGPDEVA